ncbi:MAG: hypothetical protein ACI9PZ_003010 [Parvicella sp.]|jgi:hypothetical protein
MISLSLRALIASLIAYSLCAWPTAAQAQASLELTVSEGRLIHDASYLPRPSWWPDSWPWDGTGQNSDVSYRYGPALIRYQGDNLHFWACSEGDADVADYIRYRHSSNGGASWTEDVIALAPSIGTEDGWAICDPNVVKINSYFYMAYTATDSSFGAGLNNHIFVARSLRPDGGFEKWNGTGWGGNPKPILRYTGPTNKWGLGEPNLVVKDNTLFLYYTEDEGTAKTRVATATADDTNWPSGLVDHGYAISTRDVGEDQTDVKYLPEIDRFIATAIGNRFTDNSYLHIWESTDGFNFTPVSSDIITNNMQPFAHNLGMSGDYLGHAKMGTQEYIAYAYTGPDGDWGRWNAWLSKVTISADGFIDSSQPSALNVVPIIMMLLDD